MSVISSESVGRPGRDHITAVLPVNLEVTIESEKNGVGYLLAHSDEACIRERHGNIRIARKQSSYRPGFRFEAKREPDESAIQDRLSERHFNPSTICR